MKKVVTKKVRSGLSLLLAAIMAFGTPCSALAVEDQGKTEDTTIKYVSLGDSMTNGYGLVGYNGNTGVADYGDMSYANQFADYLGAEHTQLAMSAMRAEDLHWLLELDYADAEAIALTDGAWDEEAWNAKFTTGDYWTWNELCDNYRLAVAAYTIENNGEADANKKITTGEAAIVAEYYQNAVAEADIISLGMGNGNFGVFSFGRILESIGFNGKPEDAMKYKVDRAIAELEPEMQEQFLKLKEELYAVVESKVGMSIEENESLNALANTMIYTAVSYVLNYAGSIEAILQLNPDAEIILVGLMNTMADGQETEGISLGTLLGAMFDTLNVYIAALPTVMQATGNSVYKDAKFYYAEADRVECLVEVYGEELRNPKSVIRSRFVESIVGTEKDPGMIWKLAAPKFNEVISALLEQNRMGSIELSVKYITLKDIEEYEAGKVTDPSVALSCSIYKSFEDALVAGTANPVTIDSVLSLGTGLGDIFGGVSGALTGAMDINALIGGVKAKAGAAVNEFAATEAAQQAIADVMLKYPLVSPDVAAQIAYAMVNCGVTEAKLNENAANLEGYLTTVFANKFLGVVLADALYAPVEGSEYGLLTNALVSDESIAGLLGLFGRCVIGNGLGAHPSADGHVALFEEVKTTYDNKDTAFEATVDKLSAIVAEYYDEAYAFAYDYAEENGYIAAAGAAIDASTAELNALNPAALGLSPELTKELENALDNACDTLAALKALVVEADVLDNATLVAAEALLGDLGQNMTDIREILTQAGIEAGNEAWALLKEAERVINEEVKPVVIEKLTEAVAEGTEWLMEKMGEAYNEFVEYVVEAVKEYAPEAADAIYNWLHNNPEKVIGFFNEYGDEIVSFLVDNKEPILGVLGYLIMTYGDDVVDYVVNHPEALEALIGWYNKHGDNMWALIDVYAKELGFYDLIADVVEDVKNVDLTETLKALQDILKQYGPEALDQIIKFMEESGCLDKLEEYAKELQAKAEAQLKELVENVKPQIEAAIKDLEAQLEALEVELAAKKAELAQKLEELKAMLEEQKAQLENASEELKAEIEAAIKEIEAAIEALENAIAEIEAKIAEIKNAIAELNDKLETIVEEIEALVKAAEELNAAIKELVGIVSGEIEGSIEDAAEKLQDAIAKVTEAIENAEELIDSINTAIKSVVEFIESIPGSIEALENAFDAAVENAKDALVDALENLKDGLTDALEGAADDLKDALTDAIDGIVNDIETKVDELLDALDAEIAAEVTGMLNDAANALKDAANGLSDDAMALLGEVVDQVKDMLDAIILDATTDEYEVSEDSYYVALGDKSTYAYGLEEGTDGYVERFAKALGLTEEQYNNLCKDCECASVADCLAEITEHAAEIAKADLVTVGFTNNAYMEFALGQVVNGYMGEDVVDPDWSALLPEEAVALIEEKLAEINQELVAAGMTPEMAGLVTLAVESYAYSYVEYAVELPTLVGAIHEINPDATVIIVGMYNPLSGAMIAQDGVEIAFGDYIDMIIEVSDVYGTAYAALAPNTIFVSAPEVETIQPAGTMDIHELAYEYVWYGGKNLYASEDGHEYIKDQLLGALDITVVEEPEQPVGLLGDVNCDGKVNAADVNLLFRHVNGTLTTEISAQGLINADVNFDGKLNAADVNKLFRYVNGALDSLE